MAQELLKDFAKSIPAMEAKLAEGLEYISVMEEAGEDVVAMKADYRTTALRLNKWKNTLKAREVEPDGG